MQSELTIVIPAKNEEHYIGKLLASLTEQTYPMDKVKIFVADAKSTDNTCKIIKSFQNKLNVQIIPGGLPSTGRNAGAKRAKTPYILFIDADIVLGNRDLIQNALLKMKKKGWKCATCNIKCANDIRASFVYAINNQLQRFSKYKEPFATGMFMLFERAKFEKLGGFNEKIVYAEDFSLTRHVPGKEFGIVPGYIYSTNRRFKKMGYWKTIVMFCKTVLNSKDKDYFLKEEHKKYWEVKL